MRWLNKLAIPFILVVTAWCASNIQWGGHNWKTILEADAKGYYAYLPAIFIYHDLHFGFHDSIERNYADPNTFYDYRTQHDGKVINKYYAGTALAGLPFFLAAHTVTKLTGGAADGYSKLYQVFVNIAALFYLFAGLIYTRNLLRSFQASDNTVGFILLVMVFGTNLFYYAVVEPGMSHVYSFAFICAFAYYARKYFLTLNAKFVYLCAILLGITILIRPVNAIALLALPFIAGSREKLAEGLKAAPLVIPLMLVSALVFIQPLIYWLQCGSFFVYSYGKEGFNWLNPQVLPFLFGFKKGVFIYTPVLLASMAGFIYLWQKDRFRFYTLLGFSAVLVYVLSSWWNWWYGGSFGSRVMIDFYVFPFLLAAFAFKLIRKRSVKIGYASVLILFTLLCIAQTYQYRYGIIHWENMDSQKYRDVFLDFGKVMGLHS
jgi:hypothetical protein